MVFKFTHTHPTVRTKVCKHSLQAFGVGHGKRLVMCARTPIYQYRIHNNENIASQNENRPTQQERKKEEEEG